MKAKAHHRNRTPRGTYPRTKAVVRDLRRIRELADIRTDGTATISAIRLATVILELHADGRHIFVGETKETAQPMVLFLGTHLPPL